MDKRAFSSDGYLIDQDYTKEFKYGRFTSNYNGCGWIAMFNFCKAHGLQLSVEKVHQEMAAMLPYGGLLGTPLRTMRKFLVRHQIPFTELKGKRKILAALPAYDYGIFRFLRQGELHFIAFLRVSTTHFRFFNFYDGKEDYTCTMEEWLADSISNIPRVIGFLAKKS